ncbi:hypothetical protein AUC61_15840 [Pseudomonas sp. S25]|uniref:Uncharacterized protein n=1 Tax=Pseudomonas maioricensis TaxID=1766623 RepID=A0ABS9ZK98_9PSED|nr:hypothetical protein [Pseudomonas sp. S25]
MSLNGSQRDHVFSIAHLIEMARCQLGATCWRGVSRGASGLPLREQVRSYLFADDFGGGVVRDNQEVNTYVAQGIGGAVAAILSDDMARANGTTFDISAGSVALATRVLLPSRSLSNKQLC